MAKTYLTVASHWHVPGIRQYASTERVHAEAKAVELVNELVADWASADDHEVGAEGPPPVQGRDWETTLRALQLHRLIDYSGGEGEANDALFEFESRRTGGMTRPDSGPLIGEGFTPELQELIADFVAEDDCEPDKIGFPMVWIEEVEAAVEAAAQPAFGGITLGDILSVVGYADSFTSDWFEHVEPGEHEEAAAACALVERVHKELTALWSRLALIDGALEDSIAAAQSIDGQLDQLVAFTRPTFNDDEAIERAKDEFAEAEHRVKVARETIAALEAGDAPLAKPIRVLVALDGGLVHGGCSDAPVHITIVDYDVDGVDGERLVDVPQDDGTTAKATVGGLGFSVDPGFIDRALEAAAKAGSEEE